MTDTHRLRRGERDNVLDVSKTYTLLIDFDEIDKAWKDDELTLESDDGEYRQTLTLGEDGEVVDERWIKVTFTKIQCGKTYSCILDPRTTSDELGDGGLEETATDAQSSGSPSSQSGATSSPPTSAAAPSSSAGSPPPVGASLSLSDGKIALFRGLCIDSFHCNKPDRIEEGIEGEARPSRAFDEDLADAIESITGEKPDPIPWSESPRATIFEGEAEADLEQNDENLECLSLEEWDELTEESDARDPYDCDADAEEEDVLEAEMKRFRDEQDGQDATTA